MNVAIKEAKIIKITTQKDLTLNILDNLTNMFNTVSGPYGTTEKMKELKNLINKNTYKNTIDPIILMTVGFPACGKSVFLQDLKDLPKNHIFSSDETRVKLFGSASIQGNPKVVFDKVYSDMRNKINEIKISGREDIPYIVALDATNLSIKNRKNFIKNLFPNSPVIALDFGYDIWNNDNRIFETKLRNASRGRSVPDSVMERMIRQYKNNIPSMVEGFIEVIKICPIYLGYNK